VEPSLIQRVFLSGRVKTLNIVKIDSDQFDPIVKNAIIRGIITGGDLGFVLEAVPSLLTEHRSRVVRDRYIQVAKEYPNYCKIVKVTRLSNEELTIRGQHVSCRVYQIVAIAKAILVSNRQTEPIYFFKIVREKYGYPMMFLLYC